ncbi:hypothetical protein [Flammeovirga sp. SJP92]|uniref:hypothetical protein n=1 Tax=Flammeovirga sp. SJP92 TaxID=1775430 RepID=UPI0012F74445|nr:hypothetical protein [Flammeovirga sp. SJP92]
MLKERLQILAIKKIRVIGFKLLILFSIIVPLVLLGHAILDDVFFRLVEINDVEDIGKFSSDKFFTVNSFKIIKNQEKGYTRVTPPSRGSSMELVFYRLFQFENSENIWYGLSFDKKVLTAEDDQNGTLSKVFSANIQNDLDTYNFYNVDYFEKVFNPTEKKNFMRGIDNNDLKFRDSSPIILIPQKGKFEQRLYTKTSGLVQIYLINIAFVLFIIFQLKLKPRDIK